MVIVIMALNFTSGGAPGESWSSIMTNIAEKF
jgi:hypothetical protein